MTTQTLTELHLHTIGQYQAAGKSLALACRNATQRLRDGSASSLPATAKMNAMLSERLQADTDRTVSLMDRIAIQARTGIETLLAQAAKIQQPGLAVAMDMLTKAQLPLANAAARIADTLAQGAQQIEARVSTAPEAVVDVKPVATKSRAVRKAA